MPRTARCVAPGVPYHVTQRGANGQRVFFTDSDRKTYLKLLASNKDEAGVRILAWCLMSNHIHLIAVPGAEDSLAVLLRRVHGFYAQMLNARLKRTGHLFQNRFFSCPLETSHLRRALAYVERNPVRAGMVERAEHYRWSSAAVHLELAQDKLRLLDEDFSREFGGAEAWRELLMSPEELSELRLLRRCTLSGRPYGSERFLEEMEERFGRKWRRWSFEKVSGERLEHAGRAAGG
jgi:putative transposase